MDNVEFLTKVKKLAIIAMFSDDDLMNRLVLKGGNLLDMVFSLSARASKDVDFSIDGEFDSQEWLGERVTRVLLATFAEAGFVAFDIKTDTVPTNMSENMKSFWGGYKVKFKLIERRRFDELGGDIDKTRRNAAVVGKRNSTVFCIDISKHEYCGAKEPHLIDGFQIFGYSPEMVVGEKLRAICQQMPDYIQVVGGQPAPRARDFVDIYVVSENRHVDFADDQFHNVMRDTFAAKRVPLSLLGKIKDSYSLHVDDFVAVQATVHSEFDLKGFDYYFHYVVRRCELLEALWNE